MFSLFFQGGQHEGELCGCCFCCCLGILELGFDLRYMLSERLYFFLLLLILMLLLLLLLLLLIRKLLGGRIREE